MEGMFRLVFARAVSLRDEEEEEHVEKRGRCVSRASQWRTDGNRCSGMRYAGRVHRE